MQVPIVTNESAVLFRQINITGNCGFDSVVLGMLDEQARGTTTIKKREKEANELRRDTVQEMKDPDSHIDTRLGFMLDASLAFKQGDDDAGYVNTQLFKKLQSLRKPTDVAGKANRDQIIAYIEAFENNEYLETLSLSYLEQVLLKRVPPFKIQTTYFTAPPSTKLMRENPSTIYMTNAPKRKNISHNFSTITFLYNFIFHINYVQNTRPKQTEFICTYYIYLILSN
jgi:hypothetical protein